MPGGPYPKKLAEAKYIFLVNKPEDPTFSVDFPVKINAFKKYQTSISKSGVNKWFIVEDGSEEVFRFATPVFERKDKDPGADETADISTWPVHVNLHGELEKIAKEYTIRDFPVYDTDHKRVDPVDIPAKMKGALVECSFRFLHYNFGGPDDSFVAEIVQVVILCTKAQQPPSPYKKSTNKPYRPAAMSAVEIHEQQQRSVAFFTPPISTPAAGPSNLRAPTLINDKLETPAETNKHRTSEEPEGSQAKRVNAGRRTLEPEDQGELAIRDRFCAMRPRSGDSGV
ncbi:hypothetical protein B0H10DRAFT_2230914 [Mycena sp. CBHHK59/15]|nr:hypothetical protein B0H10DRAFT_2230914 [Mycena sp. CBHHK59/15]